MTHLQFKPVSRFGLTYYECDGTDKFSIVPNDDGYSIRVLVDGDWRYPTGWGSNCFPTVSDAESWLNGRDWSNITLDQEPQPSQWTQDMCDALAMIGLSKSDNSTSLYTYNQSIDENHSLQVDMDIQHDSIYPVAYLVSDNGANKRKLLNSGIPKVCKDFAELIKHMEILMQRYQCGGIISSMMVSATSKREQVITAAISTRDLAKHLVRVKSSNVWAYAINIKKNGDKFGDVLVQFKGTNGGPGDMYIYYEVPVLTYRRWVSAPSKGHYFWRYIRNNFKYSKLTGDKRGKLPNAVNRI